MTKPMAKARGAYASKHVFGSSTLMRRGNSFYYLQWKWTAEKSYLDVINLHQWHYRNIKDYLTAEIISKVQEGATLTTTYKDDVHVNTDIENYLKRNNLYKDSNKIKSNDS